VEVEAAEGGSIARNVDGRIAKIFDPWNFLPASTNEATHNVSFHNGMMSSLSQHNDRGSHSHYLIGIPTISGSG
jgi:hypothetical protein